MKLLRFDDQGVARAGVLVGEDIVPLVADAPYSSIAEIVAGGEQALSAVASYVAIPRDGLPLSGQRLLAPIEGCGKYLAIGMNYRAHVEEAKRIGVEPPKRQFWFNKQTSCISGPFDPVQPGVTEQLDYEVELGVIIGRPAKMVREEDALKHVFGYFVANDFSARDWQFHSQTFTIGKSFDTHGPIGPWIVTADEVSNPQVLPLRCLVNGEVRQESSTSQMLFSIREQIAYLSQAFTLEPGDLLATGTPAGVGIGMEPPCFLATGDVVRCEIDGIGAIENRVA